MAFRTHLQKAFWPLLGISAGFQFPGTRKYGGGLKTGCALSRNQNSFGETGSGIPRPRPARLPRLRAVKGGALALLILLQTIIGSGAWAAAGWPHDGSDLLPDPQTYFGTLPNGFRYVLRENQRPRDRVSLHLVVEAGSLHETDRQRGLAHFLEHMLFNGSTHFPPGELVKYFQKIGMQFGPDANARTGFFETVYDINLPRGDGPHLQDALRVMADYAQGALLLPAEIERERGVVLAEMRDRDTASYRTHRAEMAFEFPEARFSERLPIGTAEVIRDLDQARLRDFYDTWYRPERMILVMVGDFRLEETRRLVEDAFAGMAARAPAPVEPDLGRIDHRGLQAFFHHEAEAGNTRVSIEVLRMGPPPVDSAAVQLEGLEEEILSRMVQNRLDAWIRKDQAPFTDASVHAGRFFRRVQFAGISAESGPDRWAESLAFIEHTLRQALEHGFAASELERVKKNIRAELDQAVAGAATRESADLAGELVHTLTNGRVFRSPQQDMALIAPLLDALNVEGLHQRFRDFWAPEHRLVLVTGNAKPEGTGEAAEAVRAVYRASAATPVDALAAAAAVAFPYLPPPEPPAKEADRELLADLGVSRVTYANGAQLNLKPMSVAAGEILFRLTFGPGLAAEPADLPGLFHLGAAVANASGLGRMDADELETALAGTQTSIALGVREDQHFMEGRTRPEELELMFQLIQAHLQDPAFREHALTLAKARHRQDYQRLQGTVEGALSLYGHRFLAGGDPRFGLASVDAVERLTLEDVSGFLRRFLAEGPLELSIVGDVDPEAVWPLADRYLGGLPPRGAHGPLRPPVPEFPAGQHLEVRVPTDIPKALVVVAYPTADIWDIRRTRRLSLLADVFSERLREQIREKMGAAYGVQALNLPGRAYPGYGRMLVVLTVEVAQVAPLVAEIQRLADALSREGVQPDEFQRAINPSLVSIKDLVQDNRYWLATVLAGSRRHPEQLDWARTIQADHAAITAEELTALARQYLDSRSAAVVTAVPMGTAGEPRP